MSEKLAPSRNGTDPKPEDWNTELGAEAYDGYNFDADGQYKRLMNNYRDVEADNTPTMRESEEDRRAREQRLGEAKDAVDEFFAENEEALRRNAEIEMDADFGSREPNLSSQENAIRVEEDNHYSDPGQRFGYSDERNLGREKSARIDARIKAVQEVNGRNRQEADKGVDTPTKKSFANKVLSRAGIRRAKQKKVIRVRIATTNNLFWPVIK